MDDPVFGPTCPDCGQVYHHRIEWPAFLAVGLYHAAAAGKAWSETFGATQPWQPGCGQRFFLAMDFGGSS